MAARLFLPYVFPYILRLKTWEKLGNLNKFAHIKKGVFQIKILKNFSHKKSAFCKSQLYKKSHIKKAKV